MADALFDMEPVTQPSKVSGDARRRQRQWQAVAAGQHPLSVALCIPLALHAQAPRDKDAPGPRCGSCRFRDPHSDNTASSFPKCWWRPDRSPRYPRITHGPGTDCRAHWPACVDYQPDEAHRG